LHLQYLRYNNNNIILKKLHSSATYTRQKYNSKSW
jgi:hypothetical protein